MKTITTVSLNWPAICWSICEMSLAKRLSTRPIGVASNHEMRARSTARTMPPCMWREARTLAKGRTCRREAQQGQG